MNNNDVEVQIYKYDLEIKDRKFLEKYIDYNVYGDYHVLERFKVVDILFCLGFKKGSAEIYDDFDIVNKIKRIVNGDLELAEKVHNNGSIITSLLYKILWQGILIHEPEQNKTDYYLSDEIKRVDELIQLLKIKEHYENLNLTITHSPNKLHRPNKVINYPLDINKDLFNILAENLYRDWAKRYRLDALNENVEYWWQDVYQESKTFHCGLYLSLKKNWNCSFTIESLTVIRDAISSWKTNYKTNTFSQYLKSSSRILYEFITDITRGLSIMEKDKHELIYAFLLVSGGLYSYREFDHTSSFNDQKEDFIKHLLRNR